MVWIVVELMLLELLVVRTVVDSFARAFGCMGCGRTHVARVLVV
jgi:hypothetical protein